MKSISVLFVLLALILTSFETFGFSDKVIVGPFSASFNVSNKENLTINTIAPSASDEYNEYGFNITAAFSKRELIDVVIDDYNNNTDVSESRLMALITNRLETQSYKAIWGKINIGIIPSMAAKIRLPGKSSYIAAFSPDDLNGTGRTIVLIESFASQDITDSFLRDLKIMRAK
jgi:hypothetical protein